MQKRLGSKPKVKYSYGEYNKSDDKEQWIRLTEGCPRDCPYCYEPQEIKVFDIPEIVRSKVKIIDMNMFVPKKKPLEILRSLPIKNNGTGIIHYQFFCGFDYRFLNKEIAEEMKKHHFEKLRIAWDWTLKDQYKIKDALKILYSAGFKTKDIIIFMICNWDISYDVCMKKMDLCKVWNVKIADCYYDNQIEILTKEFIPIGWTTEQAYDFRRRVRIHNQIVNQKIYPEINNIQFKNKLKGLIGVKK